MPGVLHQWTSSGAAFSFAAIAIVVSTHDRPSAAIFHSCFRWRDRLVRRSVDVPRHVLVVNLSYIPFLIKPQ